MVRAGERRGGLWFGVFVQLGGDIFEANEVDTGVRAVGDHVEEGGAIDDDQVSGEKGGFRNDDEGGSSFDKDIIARNRSERRMFLGESA